MLNVIKAESESRMGVRPGPNGGSLPGKMIFVESWQKVAAQVKKAGLELGAKAESPGYPQ
jgi:hypothetical protein